MYIYIIYVIYIMYIYNIIYNIYIIYIYNISVTISTPAILTATVRISNRGRLTVTVTIYTAIHSRYSYGCRKNIKLAGIQKLKNNTCILNVELCLRLSRDI